MKTIRFFTFIWIVFLCLSAPSFGQQSTEKQIADKIFNLLDRADVKYGLTNEKIGELQELLKQLPGIYPEKLVTNYYFDLTKAAVERFWKYYSKLNKQPQPIPIIAQPSDITTLADLKHEIKELKDSLQTLNKFVRTVHAPVKSIDYTSLSINVLRDSLQIYLNTLDYYQWGISPSSRYLSYLPYKKRRQLKGKITFLYSIIREKEKKQSVRTADRTNLTPSNTGGAYLSYPTQEGIIKSKWGSRKDGFHFGNDFQTVPGSSANDKGVTIYAAASGIVIDVDLDNQDGLTRYDVIIEHKDLNLRTIYKLLQNVDVKKDQSVSRNQPIGESGGGYFKNYEGYQPHLHFEVQEFQNKSWVRVNPERYFQNKI